MIIEIETKLIAKIMRTIYINLEYNCQKTH
jgi:hypothetical protein